MVNLFCLYRGWLLGCLLFGHHTMLKVNPLAVDGPWCQPLNNVGLSLFRHCGMPVFILRLGCLALQHLLLFPSATVESS